MARQKKWNSEAERLAAYRKRQAPGDPELDPDEDPLTPGEREFLAANVQKGTENLKVRVPDAPDIASDITSKSGLPPLRYQWSDGIVRNHPENPPDLEEYVAEAAAAARISASARYSDETWIEEAVRAAERYARWRHAGYAAGEISGL